MSTHGLWSAARRIVCIRLDNMGDVLMSTPAMRALKTSAAGRDITLLASRSGAKLAPFLPAVDDVITYDAAWVKNASSGNGQDGAVIEQLRRRRFDAAVIFTVYSQSALPAALMCHLAGIPLILGHSRENPYRILNPWVRDTEPDTGVRHEVQRQLDLVGHVGARCDDTRLSFATRTQDRLSMRATLAKHGLGGASDWIVAHCGASAASRRYSADGFARALSLLRGNGRPILLTGSADERGLVERVMGACDSAAGLFNLAGCLTLGEFGCLIEDAAVLISNNTGPVHIAAAVQTPVVDLYALTNPQHTPWQVPHRLLYCDVPCKYCYRGTCPLGHNACLSGIEPRSIAKAAIDLLEARGNTKAACAAA